MSRDPVKADAPSAGQETRSLLGALREVRREVGDVKSAQGDDALFSAALPSAAALIAGFLGFLGIRRQVNNNSKVARDQLSQSAEIERFKVAAPIVKELTKQITDAALVLNRLRGLALEPKDPDESDALQSLREDAQARLMSIKAVAGTLAEGEVDTTLINDYTLHGSELVRASKGDADAVNVESAWDVFCATNEKLVAALRKVQTAIDSRLADSVDGVS